MKSFPKQPDGEPETNELEKIIMHSTYMWSTSLPNKQIFGAFLRPDCWELIWRVVLQRECQTHKRTVSHVYSLNEKKKRMKKPLIKITYFSNKCNIYSNFIYYTFLKGYGILRHQSHILISRNKKIFRRSQVISTFNLFTQQILTFYFQPGTVLGARASFTLYTKMFLIIDKHFKLTL